MKLSLSPFIYSGLISLFFMNANAAPEHDQLKAFPAAEEGQKRHVIVLPEKSRDEETAFQVELIPGKVMMTDGVNQARHASRIESRPLEGWGYTFYEVTGEDLVMNTLIAVPPGAEKVESFVAGGSLMIDYNSRLPIVIYAPVGVEIRYRIWEAGEMKTAE
jgi:ecotin